MIYSRIIGTGSYLPKEILTNAGLEKIIDTTDEWIMKRVGIRERHLIGKSSDTTSSMTAHAARQALQASGMSPNDIELIVVATASADYYFPSAACELQLLLNIDNGCPAFDVNAACAGFIYGISVADQYIKNGVAKNALVVGVDALSRALDWTDRSTCVLFGDGAGAVVLQASEEQGVIITNMHAAGKYRDHIYARSRLWCKTEDAGVIHMDGREVFRLAVTKLEEIVIETLQKAGMQKSDIDWLIPHQANIRIVQAIAKRLDLPMEKVILTIEHHGNTSAASIPLALDQSVRKGTIKRGQVLMLEAFGAGLAWGSALVRY